MKLLVLVLAAGCAAAATTPDPAQVQQIVDRSSAAMDVNWKAAPGYNYIERDVETKHGRGKTIKTYRVYVIEGSQYNQLIALNDKPLSAAGQAQEEQKLRRETQRRASESSSDRQRRVAKYQKERRSDHTMMHEMTNAFAFHLLGEETVDGHECWVLAALPKPGYQPINTEAKVLTGMKGKLWIDKEADQWVRVQAEVTNPVAFFGFIAKVQPGTRFMLEQSPIAPGIWLPKHFSSDVSATALGFLDESSTDDETYSDYRKGRPLH